jgi:hypothetical protein
MVGDRVDMTVLAKVRACSMRYFRLDRLLDRIRASGRLTVRLRHEQDRPIVE